MGPGIKRSYAEGFRLLKEVIRHNNNSGGVTVGIFGSKGSGKTTFLLTLANKIGCYNPYVQDSDDVEFETIIWRGRDALWTCSKAPGHPVHPPGRSGDGSSSDDLLQKSTRPLPTF
jgi:hypothetical protein